MIVAKKGSRRSGERGAVLLVLAMVVAALVAAFALTSLVASDAIARRVGGMARLEKAAAIAESGLAYLVEQWRETSGGAGASFLDYTDQNGDGRATLAAENAAIGVPRAIGGGTFTLLEIEDADVDSGITGKVVLVRAIFDGVPFEWRALLAQNVVAPIQGVGTSGSQRWWGGSQFAAFGDGRGTVFGNGNLSVSGEGTINGDVRMGGTITENGARPITGSVVEGAPPVEFPDQQAVIDAVVDRANDAKGAGFWKDPVDSIVFDVPPTAAEALDANPVKLGTGWSSTRTPEMAHLMIRGGRGTLPAGNYAFGRLWLDGAILTIPAPPGGGTLVLSDLYLTNGARLIIDTRAGPMDVVAAKNNAYFYGTDVGSSGGRRWTGSGWTSGTPSIKLDGSSTSHIWSKTAGQGGNVGPKPARGTTAGYDDWTIRDSSVLAVVTSEPNAKGFTLYMQEGVDLVLANGARVMAGVQPGDLDALRSTATGSAALDAMEQNAPGLVVWSGGGYLPRLNINAGRGDGGLASSFTGLTYGGFEATLGPRGKLLGAFVGTSVDTKGTILYDARLAKLLTSAKADTHHVVVKFREEQ